MSSYAGFGIMGILALSLGGLNAYQYSSSKRIEFLYECEKERSRINDDQMRDNLLKIIGDVRDQNMEIARGQGRIDGIIAAINNMKLDDANEYTKIWHDGYYRGTSQSEYVAESSYEAGYHKATEDGHCTAKNDVKIRESAKEAAATLLKKEQLNKTQETKNDQTPTTKEKTITEK
jgi:hypothetical protein